MASGFDPRPAAMDGDSSDTGPPPNLEPGDNQIRPLTQQLIQSAMFDTWPATPRCRTSGLYSDRHLGALHHAIRYDEVTPQEWRRATG